LACGLSPLSAPPALFFPPLHFILWPRAPLALFVAWGFAEGQTFASPSVANLVRTEDVHRLREVNLARHQKTHRTADLLQHDTPGPAVLPHAGQRWSVSSLCLSFFIQCLLLRDALRAMMREIQRVFAYERKKNTPKWKHVQIDGTYGWILKSNSECQMILKVKYSTECHY